MAGPKPAALPLGDAPIHKLTYSNSYGFQQTSLYRWEFGYPHKAEQVGRDSGALRAPLSRLKLVPRNLIDGSLDVVAWGRPLRHWQDGRSHRILFLWLSSGCLCINFMGTILWARSA